MKATGRSIAFTLAALASAAFPSPSRADETPSGRKYLLERVGDAAVVQVYADNFVGRAIEKCAG